MAGNTTPIDPGTDVGELIGGKLYGRNLIRDAAGADGLGLVTATPAATSLLGRLKAIADAAVSLFTATAVTLPPFTITPHATNALERPINAISVAVAGTVIFHHPSDATGTDRTINFPAGFYPMGGVTHVRTGGTATGLIGF